MLLPFCITSLKLLISISLRYHKINDSFLTFLHYSGFWMPTCFTFQIESMWILVVRDRLVGHGIPLCFFSAVLHPHSDRSQVLDLLGFQNPSLQYLLAFCLPGKWFHTKTFLKWRCLHETCLIQYHVFNRLWSSVLVLKVGRENNCKNKVSNRPQWGEY